MSVLWPRLYNNTTRPFSHTTYLFPDNDGIVSYEDSAEWISSAPATMEPWVQESIGQGYVWLSSPRTYVPFAPSSDGATGNYRTVMETEIIATGVDGIFPDVAISEIHLLCNSTVIYEGTEYQWEDGSFPLQGMLMFNRKVAPEDFNILDQTTRYYEGDLQGKYVSFKTDAYADYGTNRHTTTSIEVVSLTNETEAYDGVWSDAVNRSAGTSASSSGTEASNAISAGYENTVYSISRAFQQYDLSDFNDASTRKVKEVSLAVRGYGDAESSVIAQRADYELEAESADLWTVISGSWDGSKWVAEAVGDGTYAIKLAPNGSFGTDMGMYNTQQGRSWRIYHNSGGEISATVEDNYGGSTTSTQVRSGWKHNAYDVSHSLEVDPEDYVDVAITYITLSHTNPFNVSTIWFIGNNVNASEMYDVTYTRTGKFLAWDIDFDNLVGTDYDADVACPEWNGISWGSVKPWVGSGERRIDFYGTSALLDGLFSAYMLDMTQVRISFTGVSRLVIEGDIEDASYASGTAINFTPTYNTDLRLYHSAGNFYVYKIEFYSNSRSTWYDFTHTIPDWTTPGYSQPVAWSATDGIWVADNHWRAENLGSGEYGIDLTVDGGWTGDVVAGVHWIYHNDPNGVYVNIYDQFGRNPSSGVWPQGPISPGGSTSTAYFQSGGRLDRIVISSNYSGLKIFHFATAFDDPNNQASFNNTYLQSYEKIRTFLPKTTYDNAWDGIGFPSQDITPGTPQHYVELTNFKLVAIRFISKLKCTITGSNGPFEITGDNIDNDMSYNSGDTILTNAQNLGDILIHNTVNEEFSITKIEGIYGVRSSFVDETDWLDITHWKYRDGQTGILAYSDQGMLSPVEGDITVDNFGDIQGSALTEPVAWSNSTTNWMALNTVGKTYVEDAMTAGDTVGFCLREYTYDYSEVIPNTVVNSNGMYFSETAADATTIYSPYLKVRYLKTPEFVEKTWNTTVGTWSGSEWTSDSQEVSLTVSGTWDVGYRPAGIRAQYTGATSLTMTVKDSEAVNIVYSTSYGSKRVEVLEWRGPGTDYDIASVSFTAAAGAFTILNLEFLER